METLRDDLDLLTRKEVYHQPGTTDVKTASWDPLDDEDEPGEDDPIEEINIEDEEPFDDDDEEDDFDIDRS
jgi:hypothetical protein